MGPGAYEAQALLRQAEASERDGEWQAAEQAYTRLFHEAARCGDVALLIDVVRKQARMRLFAGWPEEADELVQLSAEIAQNLGQPAATARALNVLAAIRQSQGELDAARELYLQAMECARTVSDDQLVGSVCQNLGVLANIRGDLREARTLYLECIASMVRSGDKGSTMAAYNNLGMVCADLKEWTEAEIYFGRGIEIAEQVGNTMMLGKLLGNRAEPLIHFGEFARAEQTLARAEEIAVQLDDHRALVDVARFRGVIARLTGSPEEADRQLTEALAVAEAAELILEWGEALEEVARLRWDQGRSGAARAMLREARRCFAEVGAGRDLERIDTTSAEWRRQHTSTGTEPDS